VARARCQLTSQHAEMFNRRGTAGKPVTLAGEVELPKGRPKIVDLSPVQIAEL
jgi:hypothetical protein